MKFAHITINTSKLEQSVEFYKDIAGLAVQGEMKNGPMHIVFLVNGEGDAVGQGGGYRKRDPHPTQTEGRSLWVESRYSACAHRQEGRWEYRF